MAFDPPVMQALQGLSDALAKEFPEMGAIWADLLAGRMDEATAMQNLLLLIAANPSMASKIEAIAVSELAPLNEDPPVSEQPPIASVGGDWLPGLGKTDVLYRPTVGLPRLNPLYESKLAERVAFDGDIPELRFGGLPEGARPAVPVATTVRNPVAIGKMLEVASETIKDEMTILVEEHAQEMKRILDGLGTNGIPALSEAALPKVHDPTGYERGKLPVPREVEVPLAPMLARLTPEEKQQAVWAFLSTTQGRRSALSAIKESILVGLMSEGLDVTLREIPGDGTVLAFAEWIVNIDAAGSTQSSFAFLDVASKAILRSLVKQVEVINSPCFLEVIAVNTVDIRQVGWAARLVGV